MTRTFVRVVAAAAVASTLTFSAPNADASPIDMLSPVLDTDTGSDWLRATLEWFQSLFGGENETTSAQRPTPVFAKAGGPTGPCIDPLGDQQGIIWGCDL